MNILVVGMFYNEGFALHISETLKKLGHNVSHFEPLYTSKTFKNKIWHRVNQVRNVIYTSTDSIPSIRAKRIQKLWSIAKQSKLDLVLVCHDFLWPNEVTELKRITGAIITMWFPDALVNFGKGFFMNAPYHGLFFKDPYIVKVLNGVLKSPVYYMPECFNPDTQFLPDGELPGDEYRCDITTAGNSHSWRVAFFNHLEKYDVKLWGAPAPLWMPKNKISKMHQGRSVLNQDKARAFLGAKIVINNLHYSEIWGLNVRTFEAAGIGAFQMVDWRPGLSQLFIDGKEIISFRNIDDMLNKVEFWLNNPEGRSEIAANGKKRAIAEHTYKHRLNLILDTLSNKATGFEMPIIER